MRASIAGDIDTGDVAIGEAGRVDNAVALGTEARGEGKAVAFGIETADEAYAAGDVGESKDLVLDEAFNIGENVGEGGSRTRGLGDGIIGVNGSVLYEAGGVGGNRTSGFSDETTGVRDSALYEASDVGEAIDSAFGIAFSVGEVGGVGGIWIRKTEPFATEEVSGIDAGEKASGIGAGEVGGVGGVMTFAIGRLVIEVGGVCSTCHEFTPNFGVGLLP